MKQARQIFLNVSWYFTSFFFFFFFFLLCACDRLQYNNILIIHYIKNDGLNDLMSFVVTHTHTVTLWLPALLCVCVRLPSCRHKVHRIQLASVGGHRFIPCVCVWTLCRTLLSSTRSLFWKRWHRSLPITHSDVTQRQIMNLLIEYSSRMYGDRPIPQIKSANNYESDGRMQLIPCAMRFTKAMHI